MLKHLAYTLFIVLLLISCEKAKFEGDFERVKQFAVQTGFSVSSPIRIAVAARYADVNVTNAIENLVEVAAPARVSQ